jgi:hypothetical protein
MTESALPVGDSELVEGSGYRAGRHFLRARYSYAPGRPRTILRGGIGAKARTAALARIHPQPGGPPLLVWSPPGRTSGKALTARPWRRCFWPRRSLTRAASSSGPGGSCAPTRARPPRRSTTITTSAHPCSPRAWPGAPLGTPTSASRTPAGPVLRHLQMPNAAGPNVRRHARGEPLSTGLVRWSAACLWQADLRRLAFLARRRYGGRF